MAHKKDIDWPLLELYVKSGATQKKICEYLCLDECTLRKRVKEKYKKEYSAFSVSLQREGEMLLEAAQFQKALKSSSPGNSQMLIWLGKVRLGQREPELTHSVAANQQQIDQSHVIMQLQHEIEEIKSKNGMDKS